MDNLAEQAELVASAWNTYAIQAALVEKFPIPEYALFFEVGDATGFGKCRSADALCMSCWPSRGLDLTGFEIKASRSDWMREKKNPAKAESICRFCDFWYVVAGSDSIVKDDELPPTWGLMVPRGKKLVIRKEAPRLTPMAIERPFLAALMRNARTVAPDKDLVATQIYNAQRNGVEAGEKRAADKLQREVERAESERDKLRTVIKEFEDASGIRLNQWSGGKATGNAVRLVMEGHLHQHEKSMREAENAAHQILNVVKSWKAATSENVEDA